MSTGKESRQMVEIKSALSMCSSETVRLVQPLLQLPAVQHMLLVFLSDRSRSFEDWILEPQCRHRLSQLRDRIDSQDIPALTASYEKQVAAAAQERLRTSKTLPQPFPLPIDPPSARTSTGTETPSSNNSNSNSNSKSTAIGDVTTMADVTVKSATRDTPLAPPASGNMRGGENETVSRSSETAAITKGTGAVGALSNAGGSSGGRSVGGVAGTIEKVGRGRDGTTEDEEVDEEEAMLEDACEMLLVFSEAMKEDAKSKFQRSDFMGAAKTYRSAAEALDERTPPSARRAEPLRRRIRELYVTCMCNAAVAGFKAATAAPVPGEAHGLVVEACSKALKRSGGHCPKASFWRARVKICQHMYDAAEADLRKAVEDEKRAAESSNATVATTVGHGDRTDVGFGTSIAASAGATNGIASTSRKAAVHTNGHIANGNTSVNGGTCVNGSMSNGNVSANENMSTNGSVNANGSIDVNCSSSNGGNTSTDGNMKSNGIISGENNGNGYKDDVAGEGDAKTRKTESSDYAGDCTGAGGSKDAGLVDGVTSSTKPRVGVAAAADDRGVSSTDGDGNDDHSSSEQKQPRAEEDHQHHRSKLCENESQSPATPAPALTSTVPPLTEAGRWLARVRAKIAQMDQARTAAANQASQRAEIMAAMQKQASENARVRARHGPGHVPRRRSSSPPASTTAGTTNTRVEGGTVGQGTVEVATGDGGGADEKLSGFVGAGGVGDSRGGRWAGGGVEGERGESAVVWRVPRPPKLHNPTRTPAMVMNDYAMYSRFQAVPEYEQVTGDDGQMEYICTFSVGPNDRLVGDGRGPNMRTAKARACVQLLTNAAIAWNEEHPEDLIDMADMVPLPPPEPKRKATAVEEEVSEEFKAYVTAWVDKVAAEEIHEACFPADFAKHQRKYVHRYLEDRGDQAVLSKSCTVKGKRRLSVMRRAMMEGLVVLSGRNVTVVDVPGPPTLPRDVPDLGTITRPPPKPVLPNPDPAAPTTGEASSAQDEPSPSGGASSAKDEPWPSGEA